MSNVLVVFPTGSLTSKDRERLSRNGYCAVEAADPSKVQIILPGVPELRGDDFTMAAIEALSLGGANENQAKFARELFARVKKRQAEAAK